LKKKHKKLKELTDNPFIAFQKDFLRWMLSDGASAFLLSDEPNKEGLSFTYDWIEGVPTPTKMEPVCTWVEKQPDGTLRGFRIIHLRGHDQIYIQCKQDINLLVIICGLGGKKNKGDI